MRQARNLARSGVLVNDAFGDAAHQFGLGRLQRFLCRGLIAGCDSLFDFAGQRMYYHMHHVMMTEERTFYVVCISLAEPPDAALSGEDHVPYGAVTTSWGDSFIPPGYRP